MLFYLTLKNLEIGRLRWQNDIWTWVYSEAFKSQTYIKPLVTFPTINKVYEAETLWPFFSSRIPSANQPYVQDVIDRKKIDITNAAAMLKEFGHRTIANPFALQIAGQA
ncbi:MAG: HipA N-terminal domain-containing protein [Rudanella sp.]|nr:HipA N-terminal domain-containing protein [Rudanella sp.]